MKFEPHPYQRRAIAFIKEHARCCLFLDMGLGKTVSTLTALSDLIDEAEVRKVLVIAPKKVAESTWSQEAGKWNHLGGLKVVKVMGTEKNRKEAMADRSGDIYVMSRDNVVWLLENYSRSLLRTRPLFDCIVIDELTSFKSHQAKRFKALRKMTACASRVIGLTGTPVPNSLLDLWAEMYCIDGGERLGKFIGRYREAYFNAVPIGKVATKYVPKEGAESAILGRIGDICLTMQAKDYITLPDRIEVTDEVVLSPAVLKRYRDFERGMVLEFRKEMEEGKITAENAAGLMNKLAQFANGAVYDEGRNVVEVHGEKLSRLGEIVEASSGPVLVFYQFRHDLDRIKKTIPSARAYEGDEDLRDWNEGNIDVLLAHPASTAYGLNMQEGGHTIVWYGTGWNLEHYQQANARLHRQGQSHPVMIHRLVCPGTVDERELAAIDRKAGTQQGVMDELKRLLKQYEI
jgi:SNF2 family DNA or RNA helicase